MPNPCTLITAIPFAFCSPIIINQADVNHDARTVQVQVEAGVSDGGYNEIDATCTECRKPVFVLTKEQLEKAGLSVDTASRLGLVNPNEGSALDKALKQGIRGIPATPPVMAKDDDDAADADAKASAEACIATTCK